MRKTIAMILLLGPASGCGAVDRQLCQDSVEIMRETLSESDVPEAKLAYQFAFGDDDVTRQDVSSPKNVVPLRAAIGVLAAGGDPSRLNQLVAAGLDPNTTVEGGAPVLVAAAECGNTAAMRVLIAAGADLHATDKQFVDAMSTSVINDKEDAVDLLLASGYKAKPETEAGRKLAFVVQKVADERYIRKIFGETAVTTKK